MDETFENMYYFLFNRVTDACRRLESGQAEQAAEILRLAQLTTEEMYLESADRLCED